MIELTDERRAEIDAMSLLEMLGEWRFAQMGRFQIGDPESEYFQKVMFAKKEANPGEWVAASKALGW